MSLAKKRALIIDDDPKFRALISKVLTHQGMVVEESDSLKDSYEIVSDFFPDIIILDLEFSHEEKSSNGLNFLKERKSFYYLQRIPTIVCSAHEREKIVKKINDLGATDYMVKPIRPDLLLKKVKKYLKETEPLRYQFQEDTPPIKLTIWAEITELGEANCVVRTPLNLSPNQVLELDFEVLSKDLGQNKKLRTKGSSFPRGPGVYNTLCTFLGVSEEEAAKIRKLKASWR